MEGKHENLQRFAILKTSFRVPQMLTWWTAHQLSRSAALPFHPLGRREPNSCLPLFESKGWVADS